MMNFFKQLFSDKHRGYDPDFEWHKLSKLDYISVLRVLIVKKNFNGFKTGARLHDSTSVMYKVNLVIDNKKKKVVTIFMDDNKDQAFKKAFELKVHFNCRIYDFTSHTKQWID